MIVAGEASGDRHAAKLVRAIREIRPSRDISFFGSAGPLMRAASVEPIVEADALSIVGIVEIGLALPTFVRAFKKLLNVARERKPDAVVLVDFPDLNLKLAKALKKRGLTVIYYISPQLWAWRKYRLKTIKKYVDLVLTILPFEKQWYLGNGFDRVEYVGSPLAREVSVSLSREQFRRKHQISNVNALVALLPGSREKEIARILPVMLDAAEELRRSVPDTQFVVPVATRQNRTQAEGILLSGPHSRCAKIVENETYDAVAASDVAAVTSGTATLETGMLGTPMVVVYKSSEINYRLLEPLIDVPHYGLINLIAEKRVAKELIQGEFTARSLSAELLDLLRPERNAEVREELRIATDKLGHGGASKRAADAILKLMNKAQARTDRGPRRSISERGGK